MTTLFLVAQLATLAVLNAAGAVVSTQDYTLECRLSPKFKETLPVVDPVEWYYDDPADSTFDCRALVAAQAQSLPPEQGYRFAMLVNGEYQHLSNPFTRSAPPPPPPVTTCSYNGVAYTAPITITMQLRAKTEVDERASLKTRGWTFPQKASKVNKQWEWWEATCAV